MDIIFLDIDGIFSTARTAVAYYKSPKDYNKIPNPHFDPIAVAMVKQLIIETKAKVVISSSWRIGRSVAEFNYIFSHYYFWKKNWIIDVTPFVSFVKRRGEEIESWLEDHPKITNYIIIDDDKDILPIQRKRFIKVDGNDGFSFDNFMESKKILKKGK